MSLFIVAFLAAGFLLFVVILRSMLVYIPNNRVGILEKLISAKGSVHSGLIALEKEAGFQPELLRGGWHFLKPFQYRVHRMPLVTIPQGEIGYVFARDGQSLPPTQSLASNVRAHDFQDATAFLRAGGQKGPQRMILREGTYAINLAQFVVLTRDHLYYLPHRPQRGGGVRQDGAADRRARRLPPGGHPRRRGPHRHRHRARRPGRAVGGDHRAAGRQRSGPARRPTTTTSRTPSVPARRRPARPAAPGAGRGHLLHQPSVRHRSS